MEPALVLTILLSITGAIGAATIAEASRRHVVGVRLDRDLRGSGHPQALAAPRAARPGSGRAR